MCPKPVVCKLFLSAAISSMQLILYLSSSLLTNNTRRLHHSLPDTQSGCSRLATSHLRCSGQRTRRSDAVAKNCISQESLVGIEPVSLQFNLLLFTSPLVFLAVQGTALVMETVANCCHKPNAEANNHIYELTLSCIADCE